MHTNYSGFALAVCMGLVVLLLGFLALSACGLVGFSEIAKQEAETQSASEEAAWTAYQKAGASSGSIGRPAGLTDEVMAGDALFKANCSQCHAVNEKVVGPALAGVTKRRSISWLIPWVRNSAKVIASGDDYAEKLFEDNGKQQMPAFPQLSDADIKNIMAFVSAEMGPLPAAPNAATVAAN